MTQIKINGANCIQQTVDHILNVDGWADEVFFTWSVATKNGQNIATSEGMSSVYGDVNGHPGRIRAGSATPNGGIKTQNWIPMRFGPVPGLPPGFPMPFPMPLPPWSSASKDGFPITIWSGTLNAGDRVSISPLIWEWDGGGLNPAPAMNVAAAVAVAIGSALSTVFPPAGAIGQAVGGVLSGIGNVLGIAGNRPIGVDLGNSATATATQWPELTFDAQTLPNLATQNNGWGPGIFRYVQTDPANIGGGQYEYYIQIT